MDAPLLEFFFLTIVFRLPSCMRISWSYVLRKLFIFVGKKGSHTLLFIFPLFKKTLLFVVRIFCLSFKKTQFIFIHIHPITSRLSILLFLYVYLMLPNLNSQFIRLSNGDLQCKFIIEKLNQITQILPYHLSKLFTEWNTEKADTFREASFFRSDSTITWAQLLI